MARAPPASGLVVVDVQEKLIPKIQKHEQVVANIRFLLEVAELLEVPLNTAASRYRYGLDKLRARLRPLYDEIR